MHNFDIFMQKGKVKENLTKWVTCSGEINFQPSNLFQTKWLLQTMDYNRDRRPIPQWKRKTIVPLWFFIINRYKYLQCWRYMPKEICPMKGEDKRSVTLRMPKEICPEPRWSHKTPNCQRRFATRVDTPRDMVKRNSCKEWTTRTEEQERILHQWLLLNNSSTTQNLWAYILLLYGFEEIFFLLHKPSTNCQKRFAPPSCSTTQCQRRWICHKERERPD